ncbi:hypothetical protein KDW_53930 [Dictyobacter vulcani]|uniref:Uncharacterized protein n=1 Tax=Dictyobacter vulcani TaxID=2607529 RepID=A0A5J4KXL2_9CHLR|nr:hypothetical protein KDW_53930 [Dictyobacter vulcani]
MNDFAWQHFLRPYSLCCRAFVAPMQYNPTMHSMQQARAKAHEKPAYPPGFKPQRLAAGYAFVIVYLFSEEGLDSA